MRAFLVSCLLAGVFVPAAFAAGGTERPSLHIARAAGPIAVDGTLGDPGWQGAAAITTFYEVSPGDNTPPAVKTTAWITYDDRYLYVAFRCEDPRPSAIRALISDALNATSTTISPTGRMATKARVQP